MRYNFMRFVFYLFVLLNASALHAQAYRGTVKVLADSAAQRVLHLPIKTSTVAFLSNSVHTPKPKPHELDSGKRAASEKVKVQVHALLLAYSREADGDYHLILMDPVDSSTMIAEIPFAQHHAIKNNPELIKLYADARKTIDSAFGPPTTQTKFFPNKPKITVTGILFFDKAGHGLGHAENSAEIHPVLEVRI
jgi:hypothetical protein